MEGNKVVIGIDTSNYTTSVAIVSLEGELIANIKRLLNVKEGERGLRQSDALFSHTVNLPELMAEAEKHLVGKEIVAVGVSATPRNAQGSYMPCFLAGISAAESISATHHIPLYRFSHQCGHIMAAIHSCGRYDLLERPFAAFHISGGTTELVRVTGDGIAFNTELVGQTLDLNAGQVIDRIGVYLGMKFPAGRELELLALENTAKIPKRKISVSGTEMNLSGLENMAIKLYRDTNDERLTAAFVFDFIGRSISSVIESYTSQYGDEMVVCAGGVMCNSIIKNMLSQKHRVVFAEPALSSDNAVGCACLAQRAYVLENSK